MLNCLGKFGPLWCLTCLPYLSATLFPRFKFITFEGPTFGQTSWYSVVGASYVAANSTYMCAVTVEGKTSEDTVVSVEIKGEDNNSTNLFSASQTVIVEPSSTHYVQLQVGELDAGISKLTLNVKGEGGLNFSKSGELYQMNKKVLLLVQTDRAVYKPGDNIHIRVLVLDHRLRPIIISPPLQVYINDGKGNTVKEWREAKSQEGVWSGELQLFEHLPPGNWTVHVSALGTSAVKPFQVIEVGQSLYVQPKFDVYISAPQVWLSTNKIIPIYLSAEYTHGKGVKGEATITAKASQTEIKVVPINGKAVVHFDLTHLLNDKTSDNLFFEMVVKEEVTGKLMKSSTSVNIYHHPVLIKFLKSSDKFVPEQNFTVQFKVSQFDGTPVFGSQYSTVSINLISNPGKFDEKIIKLQQDYQVPVDEPVKITVTPPLDSREVEIKVMCKGTQASKVFKSCDYKTKVIMNLITQQIEVNSEVEVEIIVTELIPKVHYIIIGRSGIVAAGSQEVSGQNSVTNLKFMATPAMAPSSKLVVYFIQEGRAVIAKALQFSLPFDPDNSVYIDSNPKVGEPGQSIALNIYSKPKSFVGLLAVDRSSLNPKEGNDITLPSVIEELKSYLASIVKLSSEASGKSNPDFKRAGALILTNAEQYFQRYQKMFQERDQLTHYRRGLRFRSIDCPSFASLGWCIEKHKLIGTIPLDDDEPGDLDEYDSAPPVNYPKPNPRSKFPETWIWDNVHTNERGKVSLNKTLPDTMSSWLLSGFSLNSVDGLGFIEYPTNIRVFKPFFVTVLYPFHSTIIRGKTVKIHVLVYNYMDTELTPDVSLLNDAGQFLFGDNKLEGNDSLRTESVRIEPNTFQKIIFRITPTKVGYVTIKVLAQCHLATDLTETQLLVQAEGETQYINIPIFIDLRTEHSHRKIVSFDVQHVVPGSEHLEVSTIGDILGTSMQNLDKLIASPRGCGEENMIKFVPNILVLDYFKKSGLDIPVGLEMKCLQHMTNGYRLELNYKRPDGSYSKYGVNDPSGSTWLTGFVLKSFLSAMPYIDVDREVISSGLSWLASKQTEDGSFIEEGEMVNKLMQGGSGDGLGLTAFSLLPFLMFENKEEFSSTINKGVAYLERHLDNISNDSYSLAISSYALHLADSPLKDNAFNMLIFKAHTSHKQMWWSRTVKGNNSDNFFASKPNIEDIEMTAYALLSALQQDKPYYILPITTWLLTQQNLNGGFASTQGTVVALTALSQLAAKISSNVSDITINFSTDRGFSKDIQVNSGNRRVLQTVEIGNNVKKLELKASGHGLAIVQVSQRYNLIEKGVFPMFNITSTPTIPDSDRNQLLLQICSSLMSDEDVRSNMVVMEINLPSGYVVDQDSVSSLDQINSVKRTEFKNSDTRLDIYFDKMTKDMICPKILAMKKYDVEKYKPVAISVYDYYDQS